MWYRIMCHSDNIILRWLLARFLFFFINVRVDEIIFRSGFLFIHFQNFHFHLCNVFFKDRIRWYNFEYDILNEIRFESNFWNLSLIFSLVLFSILHTMRELPNLNLENWIQFHFSFIQNCTMFEILPFYLFNFSFFRSISTFVHF